MGTIYRRKNIYWIKYYRNGKPYYESTHSDKKEVAKRLLKERESEILRGEFPEIYFEWTRFEELAEDFLMDYRINNKKSLKRASECVKKLKEMFEGMKATDITTSRIREYVEKRMEDGVSNATINRELSALKRMFNLAVQCTPPKVKQIPYIPMLKESNTRKGFFEHEEYLAIREALPPHLKPLATFAYYTGWRLGEIRNLTWDKVDLNNRVIRLDPGETKNEEARTVYLTDELWKELKALHANRRLGCPYVFNLNGRPIGNFLKSWKKACIKAGLYEVLKDENGNPIIIRDKNGNEKTVKVPTRIFHDFRRTAVRNMIRSGIPERVAMKISGHKTRSIFDRYNIVSLQDLKEAALKQQAYLNSKNEPEMVTKWLHSEAKVISMKGKAADNLLELQNKINTV